MLTTAGLTRAIAAIDAVVIDLRDQLNAADRLLGDGDTGMTVSQIVAAWSSVAADLPTDVGAALLALGRETGRATGSSLGSVLTMALSGAGRSVRGKQALSRDDIVAALAAATSVISERSGAAAGDKCILDSFLCIERRLAAADDDAELLGLAADAAHDALREYRDREARLGRARMYGAKSVGHDDPGMLAAALLLSAVRQRRSNPPA